MTPKPTPLKRRPRRRPSWSANKLRKRHEKPKKQAEKEALDPDADYTEDKGDFEIPVEDDSDEAAAEDITDE